MRYLIIGLGIYGSNLATDLTRLGHEVIGADNCRSNIDAIKDYISTVYLIDSTEESSLSVLPLDNVDLVIVAIGENFGASIKTVALLKKMGVRHIYARAIDKLHESILEGFEIDRIITPEQRAAADLTHEMELGTGVASLRIDGKNYILRFKVPAVFVGTAYSDLGLETGYGLRLIAATRQVATRNILGISHPEDTVIDTNSPDIKVEDGDTITVFGTKKSFRDLYRSLEPVR